MAKLKCRIIAEREATTELMRRLPGLMENAGLTKTDLIAQALGVTLTELTGL
jgi:hypothetical protein